MAILTALHHVTHYKYDKAIQLGPQTIRLRPAPHARSHIQSYSLKVCPSEHYINWQQDPFGNYMARLVFPQRASEFRIEVDLLTEIRVFNPLDFFLEENADHYPLCYGPGLALSLAPYLEKGEEGPRFADFVQKINRKKRGIIDFLVDVNKSIGEAISYMIRLEPGVQTCEESLRLQTGSCRDMAWLLCQVLRHCGLATRFTSGYLIQLKQDIPSLDGPSGAAEDFTDLHAWTEVYLPGAGWVGIDPTSGLFAGEGHIPLSCTPHPSGAAPVSGAVEACQSTMSHEMTISRIHQDPRITKPLGDDEWNDIQKLAGKVDRDIKRRDIRLTMGGEPTFVSLDDPEGDEWNFTALSPEKYALGDDLAWRLKNKYTSGGLIQYCQGKWYPGEPLPRWAMNCYARKDKEAMWVDEKLLARPADRQQVSLSDAKNFMEDLAVSFSIPKPYILEAREDAAYYLWKKESLPVEGDVLKTDSFERNERQRLQKVLDSALEGPVGYVLPIHFSVRRNSWISNSWKFRSGQLTLSPGDSPIGLRLPLGSLPFVEDAESEITPERSPAEQVGDLPSRQALLDALPPIATEVNDAYASDPCGLIRTAVCAEIREGKLHLFLPPFSYIEHFLTFVAVIEEVSRKREIPVVLEGYSPPSDLRVQHFSVTPDPGVLEVNMPPAENWEELSKLMSTLYSEARQSRLATEKFLLDGRLVGSGGGNHIVLGGSHPLNSPFLRRPDLLRSMVTFWQNHPSLSYLFSSQYIGPTCQAPRIDEARHDSLYELEIACTQIPLNKEVPPWLVDRLFRNLLVDLTGNTHRSEFCIDKLFSPDSSRGRLGLLELRGFEMPPHYQLNLLQALLVRALVSLFWKQPYQQPLVRWGTQLHDKYMLPEFIWSDFCSVLDTARSSSYDFDPDWFKPFLEFRFPTFGSVTLGSVTIELRYALEPWPILGEEMFNGSTSRSVDSSVERVQVKVSGLIPGKHRLTCNGHDVQLKPTAENGVFAGGVRYKAWAPSSSLHPNIPTHGPLIFDLVDTEHRRSLGGCKYHVVHQGGRSYETIPVNANEAEGRRLSRFEAMGHSAGKLKKKRTEPHPDFPYTLDLRRHIQQATS